MNISRRMPPVVVEYDVAGYRKQKYFEDAFEARRFYTAMDKQRRHPKVRHPKVLSAEPQEKEINDDE